MRDRTRNCRPMSRFWSSISGKTQKSALWSPLSTSIKLSRMKWVKQSQLWTTSWARCRLRLRSLKWVYRRRKSRRTCLALKASRLPRKSAQIAPWVKDSTPRRTTRLHRSTEAVTQHRRWLRWTSSKQFGHGLTLTMIWCRKQSQCTTIGRIIWRTWRPCELQRWNHARTPSRRRSIRLWTI